MEYSISRTLRFFCSIQNWLARRLSVRFGVACIVFSLSMTLIGCEMADHPFDQVFWQERKHTDLLYLVITDDGVEKKPSNKAEPSFASTVTQHTPAALKLVESYRDRKKPFNIVFFLRKSRDSEVGSSSGFSIDRLKKIESAAPGGAEMLISANAWTVGRLPQGTETKKKGKSKDKALANPDRLGSEQPFGDYLAWYREQAADPEAGDRALFKKLADCRVSTPEEARKIALQYKLQMSAQEGCSVSRLIRVARDVPEFANKGDFVWAVQFGMLIPDALGTQGVSDELWVSSTSGAVISVLSECQTAK